MLRSGGIPVDVFYGGCLVKLQQLKIKKSGIMIMMINMFCGINRKYICNMIYPFDSSETNAH